MHATPEQQAALAIARQLSDCGFTAYLAGGCVRDMILGRHPRDYDVATSASPGQIQAIFPRTLGIGKAFGVIQVLLDGHECEVATFRKDLSYTDGRHPNAVEFSGPEEDARRRDFTINGLFFDPKTERILDFVGGQKDISARIVRAIGDPALRFGEDHLRLLRAVRFASILGFTIDPATAGAVRALAPSIATVSAERIQHELTLLLTESPKAGQGLALLRDLGLLDPILPEVARMIGQEQPPEFHPEGDVFTHTVMMLDRLERPSPVLAYSVLLHDVGKPPTAAPHTDEEGHQKIRFIKHADVGAELVETILRRLKLPNRDIEAVAYCVGNHMRFMDAPNMRRAKLRQLVGAPTFPDELELHRLDCLCSHGDLSVYDFLKRFVEELRNEPALPPPWVTGKDLLDLGIPEGPRVGLWHRKAYDAQIEGQFQDREHVLKWIRDSLTEIDRQP